MDLYLDNIIDHGRNPRNFGEPLQPADIDYEDENPFCGDHLHLTAQLDEEGRVKAAALGRHGCTISQASASMLGEEMIRQDADELRHFDRQEPDLARHWFQPDAAEVRLALAEGPQGGRVWPAPVDWRRRRRKLSVQPDAEPIPSPDG